MLKTSPFFLLLISTLALSGCGSNTSASGKSSKVDASETSTEDYSYAFPYHGCETGRHAADSREGYCRNLTDDELNNFCAEWIRKDQFDKNCKDSGVKWNPDQSSIDADDIPTVEVSANT